MAVSPADFELYSRATGTPLPRTPQEQMRLAPQVHNFIQNRGYQRGPVQRTAGALDNVIGGIRNTALIGAGLLGAGLAASAYANKRDSTPKSPDPDANRYDKAGNVDLSDITRRKTAANALARLNKPVQATVQTDSSEDPWKGSYSDGAITTVPPKMSNTGTVVTDLNRQPVDDTSNYTSGDAIRGIGSMWSTDGRQGGQRFAPGGRTRVGEDQYTEKPNFSSIKTAPTIFNPLGKTTIANPQVIGTDREGNPITSTPKAAFTDKPLQFPYPNRSNPGLAFIAASTEAPTTGIPGIDEISVPVLSQLTGMHIPGVGQAITTAGPYIAGLARQGAGDAVDTMRFAGSGLNYVAKNLRPILQQGKEDFSKGVRDIRTGAQDVGLVGRTIDQLKIAAAMKKGEDLNTLDRFADKIKQFTEGQRTPGGREIPGTNTVEIGVEHDLGDNPQFDDPNQQHEQVSVAPSRGGTGFAYVEPVRDRVDTLLSERFGPDWETQEFRNRSYSGPEVAGTGTMEYPLSDAMEPGDSLATRRSELTPEMKLKAQFFDKPTKANPTWRDGKKGYEWDLSTDDYLDEGESMADYRQRNRGAVQLGEFIADRMPGSQERVEIKEGPVLPGGEDRRGELEGKESMGGLTNLVLRQVDKTDPAKGIEDDRAVKFDKARQFGIGDWEKEEQQQGSTEWVRSPDGKLRKKV